MLIRSSKRDYIWNYAGTFFRMGTSFLLLPLLLKLLGDAELSLWYVFLAVNSFVTLFQAGFVPAFARNIAYCVSGTRKVLKEGVASAEQGGTVDYELLERLVGASKVLYRTIAVASLMCVATVGTAYVVSVAGGMPLPVYLPAWGVFCFAVFTNMYFSYYESLLRGLGDIAGTNKATIVSSLTQILVSAVLLLMGFGLLACSVAFCVQGMVFRMVCRKMFYSHPVIEGKVSKRVPGWCDQEVRGIVKTVAPNALRDTVVSLSNYAVTTANTIICSIVLPLDATAAYSIALQLVNATASLAVVPLSTNQPSLQSAAARRDRDAERSLSGLTAAMFLVMYLVCILGVALIVVPVILILRPNLSWDWPLFGLMALYIFLWRQHSMCATFITNSNSLPFTFAFALSGLAGIILTFIFCNLFGVYGLALGQGIAQACYDNWKWPREMARRLGMTYSMLLRNGFGDLCKLLCKVVRKSR